MNSSPGSTPTSYQLSSNHFPPSELDRLNEFRYVVVRLTPRIFVAKSLVVINVLVYLAMVASGVSYSLPTVADALAWGANYGPLTTDGEWWRIFTCMFVHFGILHVGLNMWVLWQLGPLAERLLGNVGFLLMYLICGLGASLASLYWSPFSVSAGASGAVFGVAGAVLAFTLLQKSTIPLIAFSGIKKSMFAFVGYNMLAGFAIDAAKPMGVGVDMAAHAGGVLTGLVCGLLLSQPVEFAARGRRWLHNLTMICVGFLGIGLGIRYMPLTAGLPQPAPQGQARRQVLQVPKELTDAIDRLNVVKLASAQTFEELGAKLKAHQIDSRTFAEGVERDVIPPLHDVRVKFLNLKDVPADFQSQLNRINEFLQLREESYQLAADGVRENRESKIQEFQEKRDLANKLEAEAAHYARSDHCFATHGQKLHSFP